jgi:NAD(P)H-hydrate repair Nnr-like enzyme with NAD(P)H-hydrate epimerase domain
MLVLILDPVGGDGLVAARHLWHYGYKPTIYYPKQSKNELYQVSCHKVHLPVTRELCKFEAFFCRRIQDSSRILLRL